MMKAFTQSRIIPSLILIFVSMTSNAETSLAQRERYKIGFAQDTLANDWRRAQVEQLEDAFSKHQNIDFIVTDADGDTTKQIFDIESLLHQDIDIIITSPRDSVAMTPVINRANRSVPVILITRGITNDGYTTLIAPDDYQIAVQAAHQMARALNRKGNVLMLRGIPTATTAIKREQGFIDTLNKHYPDIRIVRTIDGNYLRPDAIRGVSEAIRDKVEFDAIYAHSDSMAGGARIALTHSGIDPGTVTIIGIDYINEAREAIRNGTQYASFLYPTCAQETVDVVIDLLSNKTPPKNITVESVTITKDNVEQINTIF